MSSAAEPIPAASFTRVTRRGVSDEIIEQIVALIRARVLSPGDRLPTETDLAEQFGVARSSVREAIKGLETVGVLERIHGGATVSRDFPLSSVGQFIATDLLVTHLQVEEVYVARRVLEIELAVLALRAICPEDIDNLRSLCDAMERLDVGEVAAYAEIDRRFHRKLADLANNALLRRMWEIAYDVFIQLRLSVPVSHEFLAISNTRHRLLIATLECGDETAMRETVASSLAIGHEDILNELRSRREPVASAH